MSRKKFGVESAAGAAAFGVESVAAFAPVVGALLACADATVADD
jgi:hypothetical protein